MSSTSSDEKALTLPDLSPEKHLHHPGLTERVASFGRSTLGQLALCILFGAFIAAAIVFVTPTDAIPVAKQVLVWLTLTLLVLSLVYGVVHGLAWVRRRRSAPVPALVPQTDLAILNWRREKSVFLGTDTPQEDASWIFQLRMAELERAKAGRTSEPRPANRLAARLFDYAIWGLVLALLLSALHGAGAVTDDTAFWLGHPLLAPVLITLSWIPIEALLIASLQQTPGQVAVRRVSPVLDQRRLCAARRARAAAARAAALVSCLVGRRRLRISAARPDSDRGRVREDRSEWRDRLGFRRGLSGHAQSAGRAQHAHRRRRTGSNAMALRRGVARADGRIDRGGAATPW